MILQKKTRKNEKNKQLIGGIRNDILIYIIGGTIIVLIILIFLWIIFKDPEETDTGAIQDKMTELLKQVNDLIPKFTNNEENLTRYRVTLEENQTGKPTLQTTSWKGQDWRSLQSRSVTEGRNYLLLYTGK